MKKTIIRSVCIILLACMYVQPVFCQTTINYLTSGLSTSDCNVFDPPVVSVSGVRHYSHAGGVTFNGSLGIGLSISPQTPVGATAYVIQYVFKPNIKYDISITATGNSFSYIKTSVVNNYVTPFGTTSSTSCTPDPFAYTYATTGYGQSSNATSFTSTTYAVPSFTIPGTTAYSYLVVWASGGRPNLFLDAIFISKIEINATAAAAFTVAASPAGLSCGSTTPVTFTASGTNVPPGATLSYQWNLGLNNGWEYGGSPAASTISTGASNTLTLTPACGSALSPVSATVTVNSLPATNTNAAAVSITQPGYSISGPSSLCSGSASYTINGLVCGSSVAWTPPPSNLATISPLFSSPATLLYGGNSGTFTLTADVNSCGVYSPVTLPVHVGPYTASDYSLNVSGGSGSVSGYLPWCPNTVYGFSITNGGTVGATSSNFNWSIPNNWTLQPGSGGYLWILKSPPGSTPPTDNITVSFLDGCGTTINKSMFLAHSPSFCNFASPCFQYSPNPAGNFLNVNVAPACIGNTYIRQIELIQASTATSVYYQNYSFGFVTNTTIIMSTFPSGIYFLRIYDGSSWSQYTISH